MRKTRDIAIDIVRAIAIVLMVAANMSVISHTEPTWGFRLISSLAAPLFITLVGMMVTLGIKNGMTFIACFKKGVFIFILAGLLDIANNYVPYVHFDVLYLIALSLPLAFLLCKLSNRHLQFIIVGILCVTPLAQLMVDYRVEMDTIPTDHWLTLIQTLSTEIPLRYLLDGWFPLLPWLSMVIFGVLLGRYRYQAQNFTTFSGRPYIIAAMSLMGIGGILWWLFPGEQVIRDGYIELFYQPVPGFMLFAMGFVLTTIIIIASVQTISIWKCLLPLGEASLFMYLFHLLVITHILKPNGTIDYGTEYVAYFLLLLSLMVLIGFALRKLRRHTVYKRMPSFVRTILGG